MTSDGRPLVDCVPRSYIRFDLALGVCVTKFMPPPYNEDTMPLLLDLIETNAKALEEWPEYPVQLVGDANKFREVPKRMEKLSEKSFGYSTDDEIHAREKSEKMQGIYVGMATKSPDVTKLLGGLEGCHNDSDGDDEWDDGGLQKKSTASGRTNNVRGRHIQRKPRGALRAVVKRVTKPPRHTTRGKSAAPTFQTPASISTRNTRRVTPNSSIEEPKAAEVLPINNNLPSISSFIDEDTSRSPEPASHLLLNSQKPPEMQIAAARAIDVGNSGTDSVPNVEHPRGISPSPSDLQKSVSDCAGGEEVIRGIPDIISPTPVLPPATDPKPADPKDDRKEVNGIDPKDLQLLKKLDEHTKALPPDLMLLYIATKKNTITLERQSAEIKKLTVALERNLQVKLDIMSFSKLVRKYKVETMSTMEEFYEFERRLTEEKEFHDDFTEAVQTLLEDTPSKTTTTIFKRLFKKELCHHFVASKLSFKESQKKVLEGTQLWEALYELIVNFFLSPEQTPFSESAFSSIISATIQGARDWEGGRTKTTKQ